jgi:hypothetical protein
VATAAVWAAGRGHTLVAAINEATAEVKYFLTNATDEPVARVLAVAFRRATVEHAFRLGKQEAGLMDYEGRDYTGLLRHLILALEQFRERCSATIRARVRRRNHFGASNASVLDGPA